MRGHRRKFYPDTFQHIYQRAINHSVLFYSTEDRLVFLTTYTIIAERYGVTTLALVLMFTHFHNLAKADSSQIMALVIGTVTSIYAKAFNRDSGRKGPLFWKAYSNAPKYKDKSVRTCIAYNYNNAVEKGLYLRAEQDRWNFLAYLESNSPFSEKLVRNRATPRLRDALKEVDTFRKNKMYLSYNVIRRLYKRLSAKEKEQLTDYIISAYLPIDKDALLSYYKSYDDMIIAINSNTGSEYDIKEMYVPETDKVYVEMLDIVSKSSYRNNPHSITSASAEKKKEIREVLLKRTNAKPYQVDALLHIGNVSDK